MLEQLNQSVSFTAFFTNNKLGVAGLVTGGQLVVDVYGPAGSLIVTADNAITDIGQGLYAYALSSTLTTTAGEYRALFKCTGTVDNPRITDVWSIGRGYIQNMDQAVSSRSTLSAAAVWSYTQRNLTDFGLVLSAPSVAATINPTGGGSSGGLLAAGTYYLKYTWTNSAGETTPSAESAQFSVSAGNIPLVTLPTFVTGASAVNIYLTPANGAHGTEVLYSTGITVTNPTLAVAATSNTQVPPTINTTNSLVTSVWIANSRTLTSFGFGVAVTSNSDKTGYSLAASGLNSIPITDPGSTIDTFPKMLVTLWRYFFRKTTATSTQLHTYSDDGTTVRLTMALSNDGTTATKGSI